MKRKKIQKQIARLSGYTEGYISHILNDKRLNISVKCSKSLAKASKELSLPFTAQDWMFNVSKIRQYLKGE